MMLHVVEFLDWWQCFQNHNPMNVILYILKGADQCYSHGHKKVTKLVIGPVKCMIIQEVTLPFVCFGL